MAALRMSLDLDLEEAAAENYPAIARQLDEWSGDFETATRIVPDIKAWPGLREKRCRLSLDLGAAEPLPALLALRERLYDLGVSFYITLRHE